MAEQVTIDELVAALDQLRAEQPDAAGYTTKEWARAWGLRHEAGTKRLKRHIEDGLMHHVGFKRVVSMDGREMRAPAYAPTHQPKRKGK